VEDCWEQLVAAGLTNDAGEGITPITYMNSTAAIKAFAAMRDAWLHFVEVLVARLRGDFKNEIRGQECPRHSRKSSFFPTNTLETQHRLSHWASRSTKWWFGIPT